MKQFESLAAMFLSGSGLALLSRDNFWANCPYHYYLCLSTLSNTIYVSSRYIEREKGSLPFDVRRSKTSLFKLPTSFCA